ncbi:MAG TPA: DEAD/DEAH box helicase [Gemmatimonadaceae bacterium]|nr:DEAD/DEAH box helicase [Gemmatimonadaceae bacterium]
MRQVRDHYLPPDHAAFVAAEPPTGRVIVIAPTRAACETIELALGLHIETLLEREHGVEVRELAAEGKGFGIVAGTGTGKTLAIRPIAETILRPASLKVGVVNREREATPETPSWNVVIVTTGIARRWFQDGDILPHDTLIVDEIHQTSAELELCLALGKRVGCRFIWLSATVDPSFYERYLNSAAVLETYAFDPARRAQVKVVQSKPLQFLDERFLSQVQREKRGVGVFLPTRAAVEEVAAYVRHRYPRITAEFYHGGEPIRVIRPFLEGESRKPYLLAMTAAGQSALNVQGLDTVVIDDTRFSNIIEGGKNVLTRLHLGANEILQMAGRVHGRVKGGRVFILSDRRIEFDALRPTEPEFQLAGDSERVAITCADLGVRADELDLPMPLDREAYRAAVALLERRGIIDENGRLSQYGKAVEAMPVDRPWAELLVHAEDELVPYVSVMASIESLHRMTREERDLEGLIVPGSDHLTAYNLYAEAYARSGYVGEVYGLPRHLFDEGIEAWAEERGALVKAVEDAALGMASIYRTLEMPLPQRLPLAGERTLRQFSELLARVMPFDLVIDELTATGDEARVSKTSVAGSWGAIAGELRYFADRWGIPRASIEGTQIPYDHIRRYATYGPPALVYDAKRKRQPVLLRRRVDYFGFELQTETTPVEEISEELLPTFRHALADALARFEARHHAVKRNREAVEHLREVYRRSGGRTPRLGLPELTQWYEERLTGVRSLDDFRAADLTLDPDNVVPRDERERYLALPSSVFVRDREVPLEYDVENGAGVARLRLPEKLARTLVESELPTLDRPLRFVVPRGQRGAVRASTLDELQELLDQPWSRDEIERVSPARSSPDGDDRRSRGRRGGPRRAEARRDGRQRGARSQMDDQRGRRPTHTGRSRRRRPPR